jgi:hypothetical protein
MNTTRNIVIREASRSDAPRLVELNRAAYPDLIVDGAVYEAEQIEAHGAQPAHLARHHGRRNVSAP